jgi:hypothetical protein
MTQYHEIIIKGDEGKIRPFLRGYFAGAGISEGFYFGRDCSFHRHFLLELLKYKGEVVHLVYDTKLTSTVNAALRRVMNYEHEIKESRDVVRARFRFDFQTANKKVAGAIKRMLKRLPEGVELVDYEPEEIVHSDAKAVEGYAPLHPYEFKGKGQIEGDVGGVVTMHQRAIKNNCCRVEDIYIVT